MEEFIGAALFIAAVGALWYFKIRKKD